MKREREESLTLVQPTSKRLRGIPVSDLQTARDADPITVQKPEVKAEDLVGLISESRRKLFQGSNFGFSETTSTKAVDFELFSHGSGLSTIKTFLPSSEGKYASKN